uniref:TGACG-sequence-specific DNA-binding protein TGA-2.1 n=1 Tax=Cajanus cajan TaxID=3821 RepID=A0A151TB98_CAJCA|nr:TGACG-sequence-specific DNA-binding protein TGA-2.1 [Cajanus cajan]
MQAKQRFGSLAKQHFGSGSSALVLLHEESLYQIESREFCCIAAAEQQLMGITNLQQSSQQAEDALSQGMEALQQSLAETLSTGAPASSGSSGNVANYMGQMAMAMGKLGTLEGFIRQARDSYNAVIVFNILSMKRGNNVEQLLFSSNQNARL